MLANRTQNTSKFYPEIPCVLAKALVRKYQSNAQCEGSKIKGYTQKHQWAFAQLEKFLRYKAGLAGVPVIEVDPAYSSQERSRCGRRHKPRGKVFRCPCCLVKQYRDANSGFVIAKRGNDILNGIGAEVKNGASAGLTGDPLSGKEVA